MRNFLRGLIDLIRSRGRRELVPVPQRQVPNHIVSKYQRARLKLMRRRIDS